MKTHTLKDLIKNDPSAMTQESMENIIRSDINTQVIEEEKGYVLFTYLNVKMALISDKAYDRMRIVSPITKYSTLAPAIKDSMMHSNFHLALDARYAVSEDVVYACFIHPLSSLHKDDLKSALKQVFNLASSFAKTYSSGQLDFTQKK